MNEPDANESLVSAIVSVDDAIKHLSEIVVERCQGYKNFSKDYLAIIQKAMFDLMIIRNNLDY